MAEVLHTSDLVSRGPVVFSDFRLDNYLRIEFVGDDEIGGLIETRDLLCPFGLSITDARTSEHFLDSNFKTISDQFRNTILMPRKGSSKKTLIQEHWIVHSN